MANTNRWLTYVAGLVLALATLGHAQNPTSARADNSDALLAVLETFQAKGLLTAQEYDALKQRIEASQARAATLQRASYNPDPAAPPIPADKIVTFSDKGLGIHIGDVDVRFSGEFNAFYVHDRSVKLASSPVLGLASSGSVPNSSVRNGLLPGNFTVNVSTQQKGYDIGVTFGFWPGIQSLQTGGMAGTTFGGVNLAPGNPTGFGVAGIDFRQQFITIGRARMGTFKLGRDIGFFGQEAILNDFTLLGAGTTNGNAGPGSVTLGRIGLGYVYTDFLPQISYTTPSASGFQAAFGIFTPLNDVISTTLALPLSAKLTGHGEPQFQGKLTYTLPGTKPVKVKLWTNFITQSMEANLGEAVPNIPTGQHVRGSGIDFGGKLSVHAADFVAYGYKGWGLGTEGLFFLAATPTGFTRPSDGYYFQGTYTFAKKLTFGASYGLSHLGLASGDPAAALSPLVKNNSSYAGQIRYALTKWVNLVNEYTHTISEGHNGARTTSDSIASGAIVFF